MRETGVDRSNSVPDQTQKFVVPADNPVHQR